MRMGIIKNFYNPHPHDNQTNKKICNPGYRENKNHEKSFVILILMIFWTNKKIFI